MYVYLLKKTQQGPKKPTKQKNPNKNQNVLFPASLQHAPVTTSLASQEIGLSLCCCSNAQCALVVLLLGLSCLAAQRLVNKFIGVNSLQSTGFTVSAHLNAIFAPLHPPPSDSCGLAQRQPRLESQWSGSSENVSLPSQKSYLMFSVIGLQADWFLMVSH